MILLKEHRGVEYTIETWDLLFVRTVIWMFLGRPHVSSSEIWSVAEADKYAIGWIEQAFDMVIG